MSVRSILFREISIILALWLGGWALFYAGAYGLKEYKARYWQGAMATKPAFQSLPVEEKDKAYSQFMALWATRPGDEPFRQGGRGIHAAFYVQAVGFWLKGNWLLCYVLLGLLRLTLAFRSSRAKRSALPKKMTVGAFFLQELKTLGLFLILALFWYVVWAFLAPSIYVAYQRFFLKSYEYLWNSRLDDFAWLKGAWPYVLYGYPLSILFRLWGFARRPR